MNRSRFIRIGLFVLLQFFLWAPLFAQISEDRYVGTTQGYCDQPITWKLGNIDSRFEDLSESEIHMIMLEVGELWNKAVGRSVLRHNTQGLLTINFFYTEQQEYSDKESELMKKIRFHRQIFYIKNLEFNRQVKRFEAEYNRKNKLQTEYNELVNQYNTNRERQQIAGILSGNEKERLNNLKKEAHRVSLMVENAEHKTNQEEKELNRVSDELNKIADEVNRLIFEHQKKYSSWRNFRQGVYMKIGNEMKINIYQFENIDNLKLILTHEIGHVLGMSHSSQPESVMYHLSNDQNQAELKLTDSDIIHLRDLCN